MADFTPSSFAVHLRVQQWKNYLNRSKFAKVSTKSLRGVFLTQRVFLSCDAQRVYQWNAVAFFLGFADLMTTQSTALPCIVNSANVAAAAAAVNVKRLLPLFVSVVQSRLINAPVQKSFQPKFSSVPTSILVSRLLQPRMTRTRYSLI